MKKLLLCIVAFTLSASVAFAVPAKRGVVKTLTLKDGTRVQGTLTGDEHVNYYLTDEGNAVRMVDGEYQYVDRQALEVEHQKRLVSRNKVRSAAAVPRRIAYSGDKKGLVILVNFSNLKMTYSRAQFDDFFNQTGFNLCGMAGSVHDYFYEQSYHKFNLTFDVVGPVDMPSSVAYYASPQSRAADMVYEACKKVDSQVDFKQYDWDNDGYVDQVYVIYAGYGAAQGASNTIWPHEWSLSAGKNGIYTTGEGVKVSTYGTSCEMKGDGVSDKGILDGIGTACHEFSHCLGLPDFYDTRDDGNNFGMSTWDLMDYGCYNNGGCTPSGYTAYERWYGGWLTPTELNSSRQISDMPAIQDQPTAYIIYNDKNKDEYYLLANHQLKGFDREAFGHGLLVLHVDYNEEAWKGNTVNNAESHQRMTIVPADNECAVSVRSLGGDPFPGTTGNTSLTDETTPSASLYNPNVSGRKLMSKPITDIAEVNGLITFNFMGGVEVEAPAAKEATNITETGFTANWQAVSGAKEYTVALTQVLPAPSPWDYLVFREAFENFSSKVSSTKTDISDKLDELMVNTGWTGSKLYKSPKLLRIGNSTEDGYLLSPAFSQPTQNAITLAFSLQGAGATEKDAEIRIVQVSSGQYASGTVTLPTSSSEAKTWLMWLDDWSHGDFQVGIYPTSPGAYISFMAAFDGHYGWEDFENAAPAFDEEFAAPSQIRMPARELQWQGGAAPQTALIKDASRPRKASASSDESYYTTTALKYTFSNLEPAKYSYKVRVKTAQGYSPWSEEVVVDLSTAIQSVKADKSQAIGKTYYLDGRQATGTLRPGIYVRDGKKVVIK